MNARQLELGENRMNEFDVIQCFFIDVVRKVIDEAVLL